jgi:hypothetical protein
MKPISRREFLKIGGLALSGLAFTSFLPGRTEFDDLELVRVAAPSISVYAQPSDKSGIVATWQRDDLVHVYGQVTAETPAYNPVWYRVWGGYMNRARLQKVKVHYNETLNSIPETGLIAEVTVPFAQAYLNDKWNGWSTTYRLYYGSVHWINGVQTGPDGQPWYRVLDEEDRSTYYVPAVQMRPVPVEEITPISPDVSFENKHIDVDLTHQRLTCTQHDQVVFTTDVSSGLANLFPTPTGRFHIQVKMPSKHMGEANLAAGIDDYVLPGVPWVSFFTDQGHAFHGTYWHDNFGVPMSHGCVNMRSGEAEWLFRWSLPAAGFDAISTQTHSKIGYGTQVDIHY